MKRRRKRSFRPLSWMLLILIGATVAGYFLLRSPEPRPDRPRSEMVQQGSVLVPEGGFAGRKNIYDQDYRELAVTFTLTSVYARPLEMEDPEEAARQLAPLLGLEEKKLVAALRSARTFVWLGQHLEAAKSEKIAQLGLKGLYFFEEEKRFYPQGESASQVIGYSNKEQGLAGIESFYDDLLRATPVRESPATRGAAVVPLGRPAAHLLLTLDLQMQKELERILAAVLAKTGASAGWGTIMNPADGAILAMASLPLFDPNLFWEATAQARRNSNLEPSLTPESLAPYFSPLTAFELGISLEAVEEDGEQAPLMAPRHHKKDPADPGKKGDSYWVQVAEGRYLSQEVWWPVAIPPGEMAASVSSQLGASPPSVDLPHESGMSSASAAADKQPNFSTLTVLTRLASLVNGGRPVSPHVLKAVWDPLLEEPVPVESKTSKANAPYAAASRFVLEQLQEKAREAKTSNLLMESLVAEAGAAEGDLSRKQEATYHQVLVGVGPVVAPRLLMLLTIDQARLEPAGPSLLRRQVQKAFPQLLHWVGSETAPPADFPVTDSEETMQQWKKAHRAEEGAAGQQSSLGKMPDVTGQGIRRALQLLQPTGIRITVRGSGLVVSQQPRAGTDLKGVGEIVLELQSVPLKNRSGKGK